MNYTEIPVLFITFARPVYARQSFNAIKKAKPSKLYFYSNKSRDENPEELRKNDEIRSFVNEIDWECDVKTYFRSEYVNVYESLWSAIDWVFANEENAIILEEDCVASKSFFSFCEQLLNKYKFDRRVWVISGNNYFGSYNPGDYDYIFSRYPFKYGWASWRDRWNLLERKEIPWKEIKEYQVHRQQFSLSKRKANFYINLQEKNYNFIQENPAWDYIFDFNMILNGGVGVIPKENLVTNIGELGEHNNFNDKRVHNRERSISDAYFIQKEPPFVIPNFKYDRLYFNGLYRRSSLFYRLVKKLTNLFL